MSDHLGLTKQTQERQESLRTLAQLRKEARDEIDRLIHFLDVSDLDPDLEDDGSDEPSLGFLDGFPGKGVPGGSDQNASAERRKIYCDDRELEDENDETTNDDEPSLGSVGSCASTGDQGGWGRGAPDDTEDEHDGAEPDESGVGDFDGLMEQCPQFFQHCNPRAE
jgi:hypothetical protein